MNKQYKIIDKGKGLRLQEAPIDSDNLDATASIKGNIKLAGDLGGTADAPTVPGLEDKASTTSPTFTGTTHIATLEVGSGVSSIINLKDANAGIDRKNSRIFSEGGITKFDVINDAGNAVLHTPISIDHVTGAITLEDTNFTGTVNGITRAIVGLPNVDNTSDANKPISTATQIALNLKENGANKSSDIETDKTSLIKFWNAKTIYDWIVASFQLKLTAGANITIDTTNPLAPIISSSAGSGNTTTFNYLQVTASTTWTITHNLNNKYPVISIYNFDDELVIPSNIKGITDNQIQVSFPSVISGYATLCANSNPTVPIVYDTDAQAFITAVGTLNMINKSAINQLVLDLKVAGVWTKLLSINPKAGSTATEHKWNLKDPRDLDVAYRQVYTGTWSHSTYGALSNTTDTFANTFLNPSTLALTGDISMGVYVTQTPSNFGDVYFMGGHSGANNFFALQRGTALAITGTAYASGSAAKTTPLNAKGFFAISVIGSTKSLYYETTLLEAVTTNGTAVPNVNIYEGALNLSGRYGSLAYLAGTSFIGHGLTGTEITNLRLAILTYETALGRN